MQRGIPVELKSYYNLRMYVNYKFYASQVPFGAQGMGEFKPVEKGVFERASFWPLLQRSLEKEKRYIDIGCGSGGWVMYLTDQGYTIEGLDANAALVERLKQHRSDITWRTGNVLKLPLEDNSYDGVLALGVLEYTQDEVHTALSELHRIIRPNGLIIVQVPLANHLRQLFYLPLKTAHYLLQTLRGQKPMFLHYFFTRSEITEAVQKAGFDIERVQPHDWTLPGHHAGLWIDWPILRGGDKRKLNWLGRRVESVCNAVSPWIASTGVVVAARK